MCSDRIVNARAASLRGWRRARAREALGNVSPTRHSRRDEKKTFLLRAAPSRLSTVRFVSSRRRRRRPFTPRRRVFLPTLLVRAVSPRVVRASRASPRRFPPRRDDPRRGADFVTDASSGESSAPTSSKMFTSRIARDANPPRAPTPPAVRVESAPFVVVFVALVRFSFPSPSCTSRRASPSRSSIFSTFGGVSSRSSQSSAFAPGGVATSSAASHALTSESRSVGAGGGCARGGVTSEPDGLKRASREARRRTDSARRRTDSARRRTDSAWTDSGSVPPS